VPLRCSQGWQTLVLTVAFLMKIGPKVWGLFYFHGVMWSLLPSIGRLSGPLMPMTLKSLLPMIVVCPSPSNSAFMAVRGLNTRWF
jgi:hypothetical protein